MGKKLFGHPDYKELQEKAKGPELTLELTTARHTALRVFLQIPAVLFLYKLQVISHFSLGLGSHDVARVHEVKETHVQVD